MDVLEQHILQLWAKFQEKELRYIMVGGFATNLHGFERITADLNVWLENSLINRRRLIASLDELGIGNFKALERMELVAGWTTIRLDSGLELDLMTSLHHFGEDSFEACLKMASIATIEGIKVPFLHINHLIEEKKKLNRSKDKIDVEALERIRSLS